MAADERRVMLQKHMLLVNTFLYVSFFVTSLLCRVIRGNVYPKAFAPFAREYLRVCIRNFASYN